MSTKIHKKVEYMNLFHVSKSLCLEYLMCRIAQADLVNEFKFGIMAGLLAMKINAVKGSCLAYLIYCQYTIYAQIKNQEVVRDSDRLMQ